MAAPFFGFGDPIPFGTERNRHFHFTDSTADGTSAAIVAGVLWFVLKWIIRKPNEAEPSL
jgi:hypothetical protein